MKPEASSLSIAKRRSIWLLSLATFSSMAAQRVCDAMLPELSRVFAVSLGQAAQVVSVFAIVYGVLQLFYGPLGDRLGKFRVIAFATLACSVGNLLALLVSGLDGLLVSRALVAMGAAAIIPLSLAWIGDSVPAKEVQETLARVGLGTTLGVGGGQLVGGLLTDTLGWRWAFAFLALLFCVVGALLLDDLGRQRKALGLQGAGGAPAAGPARGPYLAQVRAILGLRWTRVILLVGLAEGAAGFGALAIWAAHLHRALGFSLSAAGAVVALFGVGGMLYMVLARQLIRRMHPRELVRLGGVLVFVSALVIALTPVAWPTIPASLVAGFGFFTFHNVMQANATQMAPAARGTAVSLFAASLFLGQSLGVQLAAGLVDRLGSAPVIAMGGTVLLALGFLFAGALRQREHGLASAAAPS